MCSGARHKEKIVFLLCIYLQCEVSKPVNQSLHCKLWKADEVQLGLDWERKLNSSTCFCRCTAILHFRAKLAEVLRCHTNKNSNSNINILFYDPFFLLSILILHISLLLSLIIRPLLFDHFETVWGNILYQVRHLSVFNQKKFCQLPYSHFLSPAISNLPLWNNFYNLKLTNLERLISSALRWLNK